MTIWVFILLFQLPSFGGPTSVAFAFQTEDGCRRMQKVVMRELTERQMTRFTVIQDCTPTPAP